jgi:hypothetical protein
MAAARHKAGIIGQREVGRASPLGWTSATGSLAEASRYAPAVRVEVDFILRIAGGAHTGAKLAELPRRRSD